MGDCSEVHGTMKTRYLPLVVMFTLAGALLLAVGTFASTSTAPLAQATDTPTHTPTANFALQCEEGQENSFDNSAYRCWNPYADTGGADYYTQNAICDDAGSGRRLAQISGAVVCPDVDWAVAEIQMLVGYTGTNPAAIGDDLTIRIYEDPGGTGIRVPGDLITSSLVISSTACEIVGSGKEWDCPARAVFTPTLVLDSSQCYWIVAMTEGSSPCEYPTYNAFWLARPNPCIDGDPLPLPSWLESQEGVFCAGIEASKPITCTTGGLCAAQPPIAIYGGPYVPTAVPSATPTPYPVWISEVHGTANEATPCIDWNLRGGCGANDDFFEVSVGDPAVVTPFSISGWTVEVGQCLYTFDAENMTGPVKVIFADDMIYTTSTPIPTPIGGS